MSNSSYRFSLRSQHRFLVIRSQSCAMSAQSVQQNPAQRTEESSAVVPYAQNHAQDHGHGHRHVAPALTATTIVRARYPTGIDRLARMPAARIHSDGIPATSTRPLTIRTKHAASHRRRRRSTVSAKVQVPYRRPRRTIGAVTLTKKVIACAAKRVLGIMASIRSY